MGDSLSIESGKILLVEDNKETQLLIKVMLREFYKIDLAASIENSLNLLEENDYQLVLLDINLAGSKDGIKILQNIRGKNKTKYLPVIIVTAYDFLEDEKKYLIENSSDFITKPFGKESLLNSVQRNILKN